MRKQEKKWGWNSVRHEQIYLKTRGHSVDIHVYPVMQQLWDAGIQTFFSCQGGPARLYGNRKVTSDRAMVVVLKKDKDKVLKILKKLNPKAGKWENRDRRNRCGITFDASPEAQAVQVMVKGE